MSTACAAISNEIIKKAERCSAFLISGFYTPLLRTRFARTLASREVFFAAYTPRQKIELTFFYRDAR